MDNSDVMMDNAYRHGITYINVAGIDVVRSIVSCSLVQFDTIVVIYMKMQI